MCKVNHSFRHPYSYFPELHTYNDTGGLYGVAVIPAPNDYGLTILGKFKQVKRVG
jgi:hypothetical protein